MHTRVEEAIIHSFIYVHIHPFACCAKGNCVPGLMLGIRGKSAFKEKGSVTYQCWCFAYVNSHNLRMELESFGPEV